MTSSYELPELFSYLASTKYIASHSPLPPVLMTLVAFGALSRWPLHFRKTSMVMAVSVTTRSSRHTTTPAT